MNYKGTLPLLNLKSDFKFCSACVYVFHLHVTIERPGKVVTDKVFKNRINVNFIATCLPVRIWNKLNISLFVSNLYFTSNLFVGLVYNLNTFLQKEIIQSLV